MKTKRRVRQVFVWRYAGKALVAVALDIEQARDIIREMFQDDIIPYSPKRLERALQSCPKTAAMNDWVCFEA